MNTTDTATTAQHAETIARVACRLMEKGVLPVSAGLSSGAITKALDHARMDPATHAAGVALAHGHDRDIRAAFKTSVPPAVAPEAPRNVTRNPSGPQYKTRRAAKNYAAKLEASWGGQQSDGSTVEIVVDTVDTAGGRRFQVMCVTTRPEPEPVALTMPQVEDLRRSYVGRDITLGSSTYRISGLSRRVYDHTKVQLGLEERNARGVVFARTWTVLTPAELHAKTR
jgi:hypothetical protein